MDITISCSSGSANFTLLPADQNRTYHQTVIEALKYGTYDIALPIVFVLGIVANILNIMIFVKGRFRHTLDEIERCAATGLIALAISDLLFCAVGLPAPFLSRHTRSGGHALQLIALYYKTYKTPLVNLFLFSSTWLIVAISVERYLAVCHPIRARWRIRVWKTAIVDVVVFVVSVLVNIPGFFKYELKKTPCQLNCQCYFVAFTSLYANKTYREAYKILWVTLGTFIPLVLMAFCNARLVMEIYRSRTLDIKHRPTNPPDRYCTSRITLILVSIVFLYFILVCPSTALGFLGETVLNFQSENAYFGYQVAIVIFNLSQAVYFAMNFALYCSMSRPFRDSVGLQLFCKRSSLRTSTETKNQKYRLVLMHS